MKNRFISTTCQAVFFSTVFFTFAKNLPAQPQFTWAQKVNGESRIISHVVDPSGNIYCSGSFGGSVDFDNSTSSSFIMKSEDGNGFVMKLTSAGNFIWAVQFQVQHPIKVALDNDGNVFLSANTHETRLLDLDPGPADVWHENNKPGFADMFVVKLDPDGNYIWGKAMGSDYLDNVEEIETDKVNGGVYILGNFYGTGDFDPGPDTFLLHTPSPNDSKSCIIRLDKDGNFVYAYSTASQFSSIETNDNDGVFIMGNFYADPDFSTGVDSIELGDNPLKGYILNLSSEGYFLGSKAAATSTGQPDAICSVGLISFDQAGNMYVTGSYEGEVDFDPGPGTHILPSLPFYNQKFFLKLGPGGEFIWVFAYSWPPSEFGMSPSIMKSDLDGSLHIAGYFYSTMDFDAGPGEFNITPFNQSTDAFVLKILPDGQFDWAFRIGGSGYDYDFGLTIDNDHQLIASGQFSGSVDFDPGSGVKTLSATSFQSGYIAKYKVPNTAVFESDPTEAFTVYPNPANDWIQLPADVEGETFTIFNEMGALSKTGTLSGSEGKIGIGDLPDGHYTVCIDGAKKRHVGKFLKLRG